MAKYYVHKKKYYVMMVSSCTDPPLEDLRHYVGFGWICTCSSVADIATNLAYIGNSLPANAQIHRVDIVGHGGNGYLLVGEGSAYDVVLGPQNVGIVANALLAPTPTSPTLLETGGAVRLLGCSVAETVGKGTVGDKLKASLASLNADVWGSKETLVLGQLVGKATGVPDKASYLHKY